MRVLKFGGTSLGTPDRVHQAVDIILGAARQERPVVVVSAFDRTTDDLIRAAHLARDGDDAYLKILAAVRRRHLAAQGKLVPGVTGKSSRTTVLELLAELEQVLLGIRLLRDCSRHTLDLTVSFGERLCSVIVAGHISRRHPATAVDSRDFILADDATDPATVQFDATHRALRARLRGIDKGRKQKPIPVITGYLGRTPDGRTVTLGRNGSDYSAAIVAEGLGASRVEIWTDVAGVLSADPRLVPDAFVLPELSYEEAMELSYFGASVLHSAAIAPAIRSGIPIHIRNTLDPDSPGTVISDRTGDTAHLAKGISSVDHITLLTLRGPGMVGVPGTAERLFRTLAAGRVNVILISQASSEHTLCFAVSSSDTDAAEQAIAGEFELELEQGRILLDRAPDQCIVAVVGEGMKGTPGVSGRIFDALGRHNVNVAAIAQGASERNVSLVLESNQKTRALRVIHQAFFAERKRLWLFVMGVGNVGQALLEQLRSQREALLGRGLDIRVCGVSDSKRYVLEPEGLDLARWRRTLNRSSGRLRLDRLAVDIAAAEFTDVALVDCTASPKVVDAYPGFIRADMHLITPNKLANVLPWPRYRGLMDLLAERRKEFLYEANVGAGMPVISTLGDLIASGDTIHRIEGIFSGTLSYLFNNFDGVQPFSELVRNAHRLAYTEPDPREDLSGQDVARKLLILARLLGRKVDLRDVRVQNLVPASLRKGKFSPRFFDGFARVDAGMRTRLDRARSNGVVVRYVGTLDEDGARAGLQEFAMDHPFAHTRGSDNMISFTTARYANAPLVLQGAGAGAEVTAMGVFSDILKLAGRVRT